MPPAPSNLTITKRAATVPVSVVARGEGPGASISLARELGTFYIHSPQFLS